jgi:DNA polymerase I
MDACSVLDSVQPLPFHAAMIASSAPTTLYLVDGSGFIFRAFHALPPMSRPDGTPVNAVYGFTNMLMRLLRDNHADHLAVIFDAGRRTFRNDIYPAYKAQRPPPPPELVPQFALVREATRAFNVPAIELAGYEADDLIATYARLARERGWHVTVISSDKDLMQLVRDGVALQDPLKNRPMGPEAVFEKFGVSPDKVVEVQALAGDAVDNVPGIPGIGVKTAAQLITEYGDLETLLARAGEIKQPKRRELLLTHADKARLSLQLVTLMDTVPVQRGLDELVARPADDGVLIDFLTHQGFRSTIAKLGGAADGREAPASAAAPARVAQAIRPQQAPDHAPGGWVVSAQPDRSAYELVQDVAALDRWIAAAQAAGRVAVDTETDSLRACTANIAGVSLAVAPGRACYIPLGHGPRVGALDLEGARPTQIPITEAMARLKPLLEDPAVLKIGHNLKYDAQVFGQHDIVLGPVDDTLLLNYVLTGRGRGNALDDVALDILGHETIKFESVCGSGKAQILFGEVALEAARDYAAEDADVALCLWLHLRPRLITQHKVTLYETVERPLIPVVARMEARGIRVDVEHLRRLSREFAERLGQLEGEVHQIAGQSFNLASPKQIGEVLFGAMGLPGGKKSKTGQWSTDSSVMEPLAETYEVVGKLLEWRHLAKLRGTYTDALPEQIDPRTGRVHTSFAIAATATGRFSSTEPNLQNIPTRDELGKSIRAAFVADTGYTLLSVDYSQIELRLAAEMADVQALKQAFRDKQDIHALTASQVFGIPMSEMTGEIRRRAKAINFGIIYGISGFGLGRQLGIPTGEAIAFIDAYFRRFPEILDYMERTKAECREKGYVTTLFGRTCTIDGIHDKNAARRNGAERQAINAPIQGTAADILKRAMARIPHALSQAGLGAHMLLTVHDELVFEVPTDELDATEAEVKKVMENAAHLGVPLVAEAGRGHSWADAH